VTAQPRRGGLGAAPIDRKPATRVAANGYGILFAALGLGAVTATLGRVKQKLTSNAVLALAGVAFAVAFAAVALASSVRRWPTEGQPAWAAR
jgi:hypothetical protein